MEDSRIREKKRDINSEITEGANCDYCEGHILYGNELFNFLNNV